MPQPASAGVPSPTLTVAVLTHNEARRIEACLRSAAFADRLVVVDSGSTDDTIERARAIGAEVFVHADWQGFAVQRMRQLAYANTDYVFFLDADEVMSSAFQQELQAIVRSGSTAVWQIRWRMVAYGRELRYLRAQLGAAKRAAQGQRGGVLRGLLAGGVMFLRMYVLRLGFLCGGAGFLYCLFIGLEAFFRYAVLFYDRDTLTDRAGR